MSRPKAITVWPQHTPVRLWTGFGSARVEGVTLGVTIRGEWVQYLVAYWNGNHLTSEWIDADLLEPTAPDQPTARVGFRLPPERTAPCATR